MSLRRGAMDLRDLPQSRPLLPLHDVPAARCAGDGPARPSRPWPGSRTAPQWTGKPVSFRSSPLTVGTFDTPEAVHPTHQYGAESRFAWGAPASEGRIGAPKRVEPGQAAEQNLNRGSPIVAALWPPRRTSIRKVWTPLENRLHKTFIAAVRGFESPGKGGSDGSRKRGAAQRQRGNDPAARSTRGEQSSISFETGR